MRVGALIPALVLAGAASLSAQKGSVTGIVRASADSSAPLAGAEILLGNHKATTNARGLFRLDNLAPGQYALTVRHIGYRPLHGRVPVKAEGTRLELYLVPAPYVLPVLEVESSRAGIYGVVGDSALRPLPGVKVTAAGYRGAQVVTDSTGRFAFPNANEGDYLLQVSSPGYAERRIGVEVAKGKGREMSVRLVPESAAPREPGMAEALWELGKRLSFNFRNTRMTRSELNRFGSMRLCDVPKLNVLAGDPTTVILNGVTLLREASLCSWRVDEVELLELCSLGSCPNPGAPQPLRYPDPSGRRRRGGAIVIWEKR